MTSEAAEIETSKVKSKSSWRALSLFGVITLIVVLGVFSSAGPINGLDSSKTVKVSAADAPDTFWGDPALAVNPPSNPICPSKFDVLLTVDRSSSISDAESVTMKNSLNQMLWMLAARGQSLGVGINVYISVFASRTYDITPWNWPGNRDVTTPAGLLALSNVVNGIPFWSNPGDQSLWYGGTAWGDGITHATNWHDAFISSAQTVGFWTNHATTPTLTTDQDFDLVLMVTDGQPTVNDGHNHINDGGTGDDQTSGGTVGADDLKASRYLVNALRTGTAVRNISAFGWGTGSVVFVNNPAPFPDFDLGPRQPVPVKGVIIDTNNNKAAMAGNMSYVFGSEGSGWLHANNFGSSLTSALGAATGGLTCSAPDKWVTPSIKIDVLSQPASIMEATTGSMTFRITNTSSIEVSGATIALGNVNIYKNGSLVTECPAFNLINVGDYYDCTVTISVPLGGTAPLQSTYKAEGTPFYDPARFYRTNGTGLVSDDEPTAIVVDRQPLPT